MPVQRVGGPWSSKAVWEMRRLGGSTGHDDPRFYATGAMRRLSSGEPEPRGWPLRPTRGCAGPVRDDGLREAGRIPLQMGEPQREW